MKRLAGVFASGLMLSTSVLFGGSAEAAPAKVLLATNGKAVASQYIVVLKDGADPRSVAAIAGVSPKYVYDAALKGFAAELNAGQLKALQHQPSVDYIEQDSEVSVNTTQAVSGGQWGLDRIDQRYLPLNGAYNYTATAANVNAYLIDTGISISHPEFGGRATVAYDAIGGNGIDCNGQATYVAGVVGSTTYGVAKSVKLRGVRVLDCNGSGSYAGVIAGVDWVRANATKPAVAVMTLGGGVNITLDTVVNNLANSGVFVVVSAGSNNADACNYSPGRAASAYTVTASDKTDTRASFANYGSCVDNYAPGVNITTTTRTNTINMISGSSMAAAHAAGVAALYLSTDPTASTATVTSWLNTNATIGVIINNPPGTTNRLLYKSNL
jgi:subtilisin family serine protease